MWATARMHTGSYYNDNIPMYAALSLMLGLGLGQLLHHGAPTRARPLAHALAFCQLAALAYDPRAFAPRAEVIADAERMLIEASTWSGDVLVPEHGHVTSQVGKATFAHEMALEDLMRATADPRGVKAEVTREYEEALANHRFSAIYLDNPWTFQAAMARHYLLAGSFPVHYAQLFFTKEPAVSPRYVYTPKRD
jgi:hypothetical protein